MEEHVLLMETEMSSVHVQPDIKDVSAQVSNISLLKMLNKEIQ